jgi:hypothetical protein
MKRVRVIHIVIDIETAVRSHHYHRTPLFVSLKLPTKSTSLVILSILLVKSLTSTFILLSVSRLTCLIDPVIIIDLLLFVIVLHGKIQRRWYCFTSIYNEQEVTASCIGNMAYIIRYLRTQAHKFA